MTLKEKMKTYSFWLSLGSCILLLVKTVAEQFGYSLSNNLMTNIITGVCSVLVLFGLIASPSKKQSLAQIEDDANQILKEQEQTFNQIKEDTRVQMKTLEDMTIAEQIEYLKEQLEKAEKEQAVEAQVSEQVETSKDEQLVEAVEIPQVQIQEEEKKWNKTKLKYHNKKL